MSAVLERPEIRTKSNHISRPDIEIVEKVRLHNISWETYEKLVNEQTDNSALHLTYNNGDLEIMVESFKHGNYSRYLEYIVLELADIFEIDFVPAGSATFRKKDKAKGFEGDGSFYFKNAESIREKEEIDLTVDPAPELIIEVDITHGSLQKFPVFAGLNVEEVWRFDGQDVRFYRLENDDYTEVSESVCLPDVKSEIVTNLLFAAQEMKRLDWLKLIHELVKKG
jgi:Uma2 family endonuclease